MARPAVDHDTNLVQLLYQFIGIACFMKNAIIEPFIIRIRIF